jgi:hypothetical protein
MGAVAFSFDFVVHSSGQVWLRTPRVEMAKRRD